MNNWNLNTLVTDLISTGATTKPDKRDEIWASDLGKAKIDVYLSMHGVPYTNPADGRGLFNFYMGKSIELGLKQMLINTGVATKDTYQEKLSLTLPGCLPLVGKPDIMLEVKDWDEVLKNAKIDTDDTNEIRNEKKQERLREKIMQWKERYPKGLPLTPFEIKSCSEWSFDQAKVTGFREHFPHYFYQAYSYLKMTKLPEVHLLFISKGSKFDTEEVIITQNDALEAEWENEIRTISENHKRATPPDPEPLFTLNKWGKEQKNWKLAYSPYLEHIMATYYPNQIIK